MDQTLEWPQHCVRLTVELPQTLVRIVDAAVGIGGPNQLRNRFRQNSVAFFLVEQFRPNRFQFQVALLQCETLLRDLLLEAKSLNGAGDNPRQRMRARRTLDHVIHDAQLHGLHGNFFVAGSSQHHYGAWEACRGPRAGAGSFSGHPGPEGSNPEEYSRG